MKNNYHIIIAGGFGSRFWPRSRKIYPKQLLKIFGNESMIRLTVNRLKSISNTSNILIVASEKLCTLMKLELPEIPNENFIIEPSGKNTAPAIGLAAIHVYNRDVNAVMCVHPADHLITETKKFCEIVENGINFVINSSALITMGIKPTYPSTGYGYIQIDTKHATDNGINKVKTFAEKPPVESAKRFIKSGDFLWNSGIFIWKAETILLEMKTFMPELHESLDVIYDSLKVGKYDIALKREWEIIKSESIDYGIMEKSKNVFSIEADFTWNDMGTWKSVYDVLSKDENGMVLQGNVISNQSQNSIIYSQNKLTAVIDINNLVVVNTDDATLIMPLNKAEKVKDIVKQLKESGMVDFL
ncbi:MAG: mannose-1-phosphate guanylyltransferase [Candidatus Marinimicrobia bacterium]|nr:mannose-1-phosphate guanylyltransferase [Candidatus Neomarinimicrobiota bacterium]